MPLSPPRPILVSGQEALLVHSCCLSGPLPGVPLGPGYPATGMQPSRREELCSPRVQTWEPGTGQQALPSPPPALLEAVRPKVQGQAPSTPNHCPPWPWGLGLPGHRRGCPDTPGPGRPAFSSSACSLGTCAVPPHRGQVPFPAPSTAPPAPPSSLSWERRGGAGDIP